MIKIIEDFRYRFERALSIRGVKPIDLANNTGISESTISQYRSGYSKPKDKRLAIIANALDVNPAWLMGFDVPMDRNAPDQVYSSGVTMELSRHESDLIGAYRAASADTRAAACAVLGIKGDIELSGEKSSIL